MKPSETEAGIDWLHQFDTAEIHTARLIIDTLKLVSLAEFEAAIIDSIQTIINQTTGSVALVPIDKKVIDGRASPGSEDRISHLFTNIKRANPSRVLIWPTEEEMFETKIDEIILVDDFIASGQRIRSFWQKWNPKRVKSWISFKYCRLWVVAYAIHADGISSSNMRLLRLNSEQLVSNIKLVRDTQFWPTEVIDFFERNAARTNNSRYPLGFGDIACPIVFQYGCPDNCPSILWSNGTSYRALFPSRSVFTDQYEWFAEHTDTGRNPELLWKVGQNSLALSLIDELSTYRPSERIIQIVTIIGLRLRGVSTENLATLLTVDQNSVRDSISACQSLSLLDSQYEVTNFGRDFVARLKGQFLTKSIISEPLTEESTFYIPSQFEKKFCGVQ